MNNRPLINSGAGYVLQFRSVDHQAWSSDPVCMLVYQYLWRNCLFADYNTEYRGNALALRTGDFATTMLELGERCAVASLYAMSKNPDAAIKSAMKRALDKLVAAKALAYRTVGAGCTTCIVISMLEYSAAQAFSESLPESQTKTPKSHVQPSVSACAESLPESQPESLKKQRSIINNDLNKSVKFTDEDVKCAEYLKDKVQQVAPHAKVNIAKWADVVRLMRTKDGLTHRKICEVFNWANQDSFWRTNVLSANKLREKFAELEAKSRAGANHSRLALLNQPTAESNDWNVVGGAYV